MPPFQLFQLHVEVLDVNDHEPVFSHQLYRANVSERVNVGRHVLRVSATDRDKDDRLLYSLASAASTTTLRKFSIGLMNGESGQARQSINQSSNQSVNRSVNQSVNQSIKPPCASSPSGS